MSVTLHTDLGDLKIEVHCDSTPRAAEVCVQFHFYFKVNLNVDMKYLPFSEFLSVMCKVRLFRQLLQANDAFIHSFIHSNHVS